MGKEPTIIDEEELELIQIILDEGVANGTIRKIEREGEEPKYTIMPRLADGSLEED